MAYGKSSFPRLSLDGAEDPLVHSSNIYYDDIEDPQTPNDLKNMDTRVNKSDKDDCGNA